MTRFTLPTRFLTGLALMALSALSFSAFGQTPTPGDLSSITSATPKDDWSMTAWRMMLGDFATNPFTLGAPESFMGKLFLVVNTAIFTLGTAWAMYSIVSGVVQTAHEGEVLGKRMSTVWFPIRMCIGIVGMIPVFRGFTMFQAVMMFMIAVGIGLGNLAWNTGVNLTSELQALINKNNFTPSTVSEVRKAAQVIFLSQVCLAAEQEAIAGHSVTLSPQQQVGLIRFGDSAADLARREGGFRFGSLDDPNKCGFLSLKASARSRSAMTAFRVESVDYDAIAATATRAYVTHIAVLEGEQRGLASSWLAKRNAALAAGKEPPAFPLKEIEGLTDKFVANTQQAIQDAASKSKDGLSKAARDNMLRVGWAGAGSWFSTFAEVNAAVADAARGPTVNAQPPDTKRGEVHESTEKVVKAAEMALRRALAGELGEGSTGDSTSALIDSALKDTCKVGGFDMSGSIGTPTGNCSVGQAVVSAAIRGTAMGSGGGGNGEGTIGLDSSGLVNPIIMSKNLGDWLMTFSTGIIGADLFGPMLAKFVPQSWAVKAAGVIGGAGKSESDSSKNAKVETMEFAKTFAMVFLVVGVFLSIYIPLVPFITWIAALMAYIGSVFEGIVGGSMLSVAHLAAEGEGMGERTSIGYTFMVNVLLRPALMVVGFFAATTIVVMVGTLQAWMFMPAMANAQGNSMTGLATILGYVIVFAVMNVTLVSASFSLISVITDQVIGFFGGAREMSSHMGRDTEGKANQVFMMAGGSASGAISQVDRLRKELSNKDGGPSGGAGGGAGKVKKSAGGGV